MFNAMLKKGKSNKGFTLIELIVVIAILAILALLLVPRFAGFTDDAKVKADAAAAKTIQTAVATLLAQGTISGDGVFDMPSGGAGPFGVTGISNIKVGAVSATSALLMPEVHKFSGIGYKAQAATKLGFRVTITATGDVTVATY